MTGVLIEVDDAAVIDALARLGAAGDNPHGFLENIGEILLKSTRERFRTETDPEGKPWAPLNPLYAAGKKAGTKILEASGQLASTIVYQIAESALVVGTNRPHARVHQFGATIVPKSGAALVFSMGGETIRAKSVTVPARPFLGVSTEDRERIVEFADDFFADLAGGAGGAAPGR
ncbi:phage virion morphogenesis protein [Pinisolibacter sp.]|uniref:phage virion morphogenesis protein n=1 Tax=Pinisolibacter sp. TaxID=2172024 RepID=UPI002FDE5F4B